MGEAYLASGRSETAQLTAHEKRREVFETSRREIWESFQDFGLIGTGQVLNINIKYICVVYWI